MYDIEDGRFPELVAAAGAYCDLIEHLDTLSPEALLAGVFRLLPQIHAAVVSMPSARSAGPLHPLVDLETRFALYCRLHEKLGESDAYWMEYDRSTPNGSLADDLTDIYFDLRRGLQLLEDGNVVACARAALAWSRSYELHWGEHLVNAERHLFHLMRSCRQGCRPRA
ncbi:MAG: DUF5063 domain-containing protein [Gammaproteobacteria bacterium]